MNKPLLVAVSAFIIVLCLGVLLVSASPIPLAVFNVLLGNKIYALTVKYQPSAVYYQSEVVSVSFHWIFTLKKAKVPIETILRNYKTVVGEPSFSLGNDTFTLSLNVLVWVSNRVKLFVHTFTFEDVEPRQITMYLHNYKLDYGTVHVEITGHYVYGEVQADFSVGEVLEAT